MATTTARQPAQPSSVPTITLVATIWQALIAVGCIGLIGVLATADWGERNWLRYIALAFAVVGAPLNGFAAYQISRRDRQGRLIAILVDYIIGTGSLLSLLGVLGLYDGIDTIAARFHDNAWWLLGVLVGYVISAAGDRYTVRPATQRQFHRVGNYVMGISVAIMLLLMGLIQGLFGMLGGLANPNALGLLVVAAGSLGVAAALWRSQVGVAFGATTSDGETLSGFAFVAPNLLGFLFFFAGPLLLSLFLSMTNSDSFTYNFIWFENYAKIFSFDIGQLATPTQRASEVLDPGYVELARNVLGSNIIIGAKDKLFWIGLWNTFVFCYWTTLLGVIPALLVANVLNSKLPGMTFFRAIYFIPSIAGVVGVAVIWKWLYNSNVGFLNYGLNQLAGVLNIIPGVNISDINIPWLASQDTALGSIILMAAWQILGFNTILFLAGLQGIPGEIYEAATLDGANTWQRFRSITLPLLAPTTFFVVTTTLIQTLQVFSEIFVMTPSPGGGPNNATLSAVLYLYQKGFSNFEQGYAAAVAWVLFLFIFAVTLVQFRIQRAYGDV